MLYCTSQRTEQQQVFFADGMRLLSSLLTSFVRHHADKCATAVGGMGDTIVDFLSAAEDNFRTLDAPKGIEQVKDDGSSFDSTKAFLADHLVNEISQRGDKEKTTLGDEPSPPYSVLDGKHEANLEEELEETETRLQHDLKVDDVTAVQMAAQGLSLGDIFRAFKSGVKKGVFAVVRLVISLLKRIVKLTTKWASILMRGVGEAFALMLKAFDAPIDINRFLPSFLKVKGSIPTFSALDAASFVVAIPLTLLHKVQLNSSPLRMIDLNE